MDFPGIGAFDRTGLVDRAAEHVHDPAQRGLADRHGDRLAGVGGHQVALEPVGGAQRNGADDAIAQLLLHFQGDFGVVDLERVVHLRYLTAREFDVDDGADDLNDLALTHVDVL